MNAILIRNEKFCQIEKRNFCGFYLGSELISPAAGASYGSERRGRTLAVPYGCGWTEAVQPDVEARPAFVGRFHPCDNPARPQTLGWRSAELLQESLLETAHDLGRSLWLTTHFAPATHGGGFIVLANGVERERGLRHRVTGLALQREV